LDEDAPSRCLALLHRPTQRNENLSDDDSHVSSPAYTRILLDLSSIAQTVSDHASGAMDGLSAAASVIAVIQISEDVVSLCSQYLKAVKNAKSDIVRLQGELSNLKTVLEGAQKLLEGPNAVRLETSRLLLDGLRGCYSQLEDLGTKLKDHLITKHKGKGMRLFGLRALKWPFESKKVDNVIQTLSKFRDTLSASLNIDQMYVADSSLATARSLMLLSLELSFSTISNESMRRNGSRF
jgi:hypothetical protein